MQKKGQAKSCPICRKQAYDKKTYVEGQRQYLIGCIINTQKLARGFLQRNAFYLKMKQEAYQPYNPTIKKRFIGFKLGRIGKRTRDAIEKSRDNVVKMVTEIDKNIKDTEALLASFMPNIPSAQ